MTSTSTSASTVYIGQATGIPPTQPEGTANRDWTKSQYAEIFQLIQDMEMGTRVPISEPGVPAKTYRNRLTAADSKFGIRKALQKGIKVQFKIESSDSDVMWIEKRRG